MDARELREDFGKSLFRARAKLSLNLHFNGRSGSDSDSDVGGGGHTDICPDDQSAGNRLLVSLYEGIRAIRGKH